MGPSSSLSSRTSPTALFLKAIVIFSPGWIALIIYNLAFNRDYFLLVEARTYIVEALKVLSGKGIAGWFASLSTHDFVTERLTNKLYYLTTASACGIGLSCNNFFQILLVAACAFFYGALLRQIKVPMIVSVFLPLIWVFSHATLFAVHWQATALDKLLGVFSMLYLVVLNFFLARPALLKDIILANISLGALLLLTLSSKEHSVLIAPLSLVLSAIFVYGRVTTFKGALFKSLAPMLIAFVHGVLFLKWIAIPSLFTHTAGIYDGNPESNFLMFMGFAFNSYDHYDGYNHFIVYTFLSGLISLVAIAAFRYFSEKRRLSLEFLLMLWSGLSGLGFLAAIARIHTQNRYYLLVPSLFLYLCAYFQLSLWVGHLLDSLYRDHVKSRFPWRQVAVGLVLFSYGVFHVRNFVRYYNSDFKPLVIQSRNFVSSRSIAEAHIPHPLLQTLYLVSEVHERVSSILFSDFAPYPPLHTTVFWFQDASIAVHGGEERVKFVDKKEFTPAFHRDPDSYYLVFDHELNLAQVDRGSVSLWSRPE